MAEDPGEESFGIITLTLPDGQESSIQVSEVTTGEENTDEKHELGLKSTRKASGRIRNTPSKFK